jgi:hypothetical protein
MAKYQQRFQVKNILVFLENRPIMEAVKEERKSFADVSIRGSDCSASTDYFAGDWKR